MTDEDAGEEERQKVMNSVKREWFSFWQDTGDEGTWKRRRSTITQLLSLYRNLRGDCAEAMQAAFEMSSEFVASVFNNQENAEASRR